MLVLSCRFFNLPFITNNVPRVTFNKHSAWWLCFLLIALCLPFTSVAAPTYTVSISGADSYTSLLNEHLDVAKRADTADISEEEVQRLVAVAPAQIRSLLATEGYFSPVVSGTLDQQSSPWAARFNVELGAPTKIEAVDISFSGDITEKNPRRITQLRENWDLQPGAVFRQSSWDSAKGDLLKAMLNRDYPAAAIAHSEARIDPATNSAVLTVQVNSGPAFTFGELEIVGLNRYSREMVEKLNPIKPGERYSQEKLNELQARVQDTGYFRSAFATIVVDPANPHHVPIKLDLTENERRRLSLGLGFSTDSGARAQIKWTDRHFLGKDWRLESQLRADRENRLLGSDVYLPTISNDWRPSVGAHYEYTDSAGETNNKFRTGARLISPDKRNESIIGVSFLADRQRIGNVYGNNRQALIATYTYTQRRVNNLISPTRGYYASLELGVGPSGLINKKSLVRTVGRVTWLSPRWGNFQTVLRSQVGQVFGADSDTVPGDLLFRTGGDQSVRGYDYNSLGVAQDGAIVGGTVSAVVSAEVIYSITPEWGAAVFTDAGNAANTWKNFRMKQGSGVGARWRSPIGPVNLDLAYGHDSKDLRLHFSIGYGF
ncbi:Translocation and assembly module TamA precursor [compost metagenome]